MQSAQHSSSKWKQQTRNSVTAQQDEGAAMESNLKEELLHVSIPSPQSSHGKFSGDESDEFENGHHDVVIDSVRRRIRYKLETYNFYILLMGGF